MDFQTTLNKQVRRTLKNTYVSRVLWHVIGPFLSRMLQSGLKRKTNTTLFLLYWSKRHLDNPRKIVRFLTFLRCTERVCRRKNSLALEMASPSNAIRLLKSLRQYKIMTWLHWPSRDTSQHIWILLPRWQEAAWLVGLKSDFPCKSYCTGRFILKSLTGTCFEVQLVFEGKEKFPWHLLLDFPPMTRQLEKESCHSSIMTIYCH